MDLAGKAAPPELIFDMGQALMADGDHPAAAALYEELLVHPDIGGGTRLATLRQLSRATFHSGQFSVAEAWLEEAVRAAGPGRPDQAAGALINHGLQRMLRFGPQAALPLAVRARQLAAEANVPLRAAIDAGWAMCAYLSGDPRGLSVAEEAAGAVGQARAWRVEGMHWWDPVMRRPPGPAG